MCLGVVAVCRCPSSEVVSVGAQERGDPQLAQGPALEHALEALICSSK